MSRKEPNPPPPKGPNGESMKPPPCNHMWPRCASYTQDGAGGYCKLLPMDRDKDYPHKYWRVMCLGTTEHPLCEKLKRNGKLNEKRNN